MRLLIVSSHYEGDEILDQDSNKYGNQLLDCNNFILYRMYAMISELQEIPVSCHFQLLSEGQGTRHSLFTNSHIFYNLTLAEVSSEK